MAKPFSIGKRQLSKNNHLTAPEESQFNWSDINLDEYTIDKPVCIIWGGTGTDNNKTANGNAKVIESLLGVFSDDVDILAVNYNTNSISLSELENNCSRIVNKLLLPLVSKNGQRIDYIEACRNIRKVNMFAHCFGDTVVKYLVNSLQDNLEYLKYTKKEIDTIIEQIFVVSYAITTGNTKVKLVNVISPNDEQFPTSGHKWWQILANRVLNNNRDIKNGEEVLDEYKIEMSPDDAKFFASLNDPNGVEGSNKIKQFYRTNNRCFIFQAENTIHLIPSRLRTGMEFDHYLTGMSRTNNWQPKDNVSLAGDYVSRCLACALCNAVANSIQNCQQNKQFKAFDISALKKQLQEVVKPLNSKFTSITQME